MLRKTDKYSGGKRFYYDDQTGKFYLSATTFCSIIMGENKHLTKWKQEHGVAGARLILHESSNYGTLMHHLCEWFLNHEYMDQRRLEQEVSDYCRENRFGYKYDEWLSRLNKDLLSFAQFVHERQLTVINTEFQVKRDITDQGGLAGTVDIHGEINWRKGRREVIIDLKSGQKGFYDSHKLQLEVYRYILDKPDLMLFNWAPKDWTGSTPTYTFTNQTDSVYSKALYPYLELAELFGLFSPKIKKMVVEDMQLGKAPEFTVKTLRELMEGPLKTAI